MSLILWQKSLIESVYPEGLCHKEATKSLKPSLIHILSNLNPLKTWKLISKHKTTGTWSDTSLFKPGTKELGS